MEPLGAVGVDGRIPGWLSHLEGQGLSDATVEIYLRGLRQFITYCRYKKIEVEEVDWSFLEEWIRHLRGAKRSCTTINNRLQAIGSFFDYLVRIRVIQHNPRRDVRSLKVVRKIPQFFSEAASSEMLDQVRRCLDLAVLETMYGCGLRNSEIQSINTQDVLWDQALIRVTGKGEKQRLVPIPITCLKALKAWLPERQRLVDRWRRPVDDALFINKHGRRFKESSVVRIVRTAAKGAGLDRRVYPHLWRHTYATHIYNNGADIRTVQELLGHAHIQTTEIYTHVATKKLIRTVEQFHPRSGCRAEN